MERRNLLKSLFAFALAPTIVDEIQIPQGRSFVSLYTPRLITKSQVIALELERISQYTSAFFEQKSAFYEYITRDIAVPSEIITSRDMRVPLKFK